MLLNEMSFGDVLASQLEGNARCDPDDYTQDGLLYCGTCKTPKQYRVGANGWLAGRIVSCMCECQTYKHSESQKQQQTKDRIDKAHNTRLGLIHMKEVADMRFEHADSKQPKVVELARNYVKNWQRALSENVGIAFWGDVGTGKTFIAACIANALADAGVPVLFTSAARIINAVSGMNAEERIGYLKSMKLFDLVVLDDLGAERDTSFSAEWITMVIDTRLNQNLPLIITTNWTLDEINDPKNITHKRVFDRVHQMCQFVRITGESRRREAGLEKRKTAEEIFWK